MLVLFTDSDCDITPSMAEKLGYRLIIMPYIIGDEMIYPYSSDDDHSTPFYQKLRNKVMPKTCGISPMDYINYFEPEFEKGNDILYVHFSKAMTSTFEAMNEAYKELKEKYPDRNLYTIDTKGITILSYNICLEVSRLYKENKSIDEILKWANDEVDHFAVYFFATDLQFFKRSGRISNFAAIMGGIIGIHPIIHMDSDGMMKSIDKARGKKNAIMKLINYVKELALDIDKHTVIIGHSDALSLAMEVKNILLSEMNMELDIEIVEVNPTAGAHCGPDNIGICFHSKGR